jgi:hypothetical protein
MATTRGKGTSGRRTPAAPAAPADTAETAGETRARAPRPRAPGDEIGGTPAPAAEVQAPARGRTPRAAPGAGVAAAETPAAGLTEAGAAPDAPRPTRGRGRTDAEKLSPVERASGKRGGRKKRETYTETAARRRKEKEVDQLQADLRAFAIARPAGWNHDDWVAFLGHLAERGHDVSDHGTVGIRLERERLAVALEAIEGLGPKRVHSLVDRFQTLWSMRQADPAAVAGTPGMTRPLAERVLQALRERYP